jgi:UDP-N-acetylmuramoyl-L-alanyl-D-glutamate--2,6-diaminopimelate ligase
MMTRSLADLTVGLASVPAGVVVSDITLDSREVTPGALFLACSGRKHHGLEFASQAIAQGAAAVLYEPENVKAGALPKPGPAVFVGGVPRLGQHVGSIADRFFGSPSAAMTVAGITGTNGKTTCAFVLAQALNHCGRPSAYAGTIGYGMPSSLNTTTHTTSDAVTVHRQLEELRRLGAESVCMEVTSHALDQGRVNGVRFHTAVFTNLTRDHLDYHGTMDAYAASKALLFAWSGVVARVINIDDEFGEKLAKQPSSARLIVTTRKQPPEGVQFVRAASVEAAPSGLVIGIESSWGSGRLAVPFIGDFNVDNVLTVLATMLAWGIRFDDATSALAKCRAPTGRMEVFGGRDPLPLVVVDYAHTPDALSKALRAARLHCRGRLSVIFGCGGDRDMGKRPLMGTIAAELADHIVLTDDNPRTEDPRRIVADITAGLRTTVVSRATSVRVEHDRRRAITSTLAKAVVGDVIVVAGKGHEDYQIYGTERRPFSDQAVIREYFGEQA